MMGVSEETHEIAGHSDARAASKAVAAALEAQRKVSDGAPSVNAILQVMGRRPDGHATAEGPNDVTADEAVRCLLDGGAA